MDPSKPLHLFDYQKAILNCNNRKKLTRCGRQIGKTLCMAVDILHTAWTNNYAKILYVAPYQAQVKVLFDKTLMPLIHDVPEIRNSISKMPSHPYYQAIFKNGAEISAMTAGTKSGQKGAGIRGNPADHLYLDEMDYMGTGAISAVTATTFSRPNARIWVSSTPTGKREEFYHWAMDSKSDFICKKCQREARDGSPFHYQSHVSPLFTEETDTFYRNQLPTIEYMHEVLADWGEEAQGVFRHGDIDICLELGMTIPSIDPDTGEEEYESYAYEDLRPDPRNFYVMGVDWNTETTGVQLCIIEYNPSDAPVNGVPTHLYRLFRTEIVNNTEFTEHGAVGRVMALDKEMPLKYIYVDEGYGTIWIEALKKKAIDAGRLSLAEKIRPINLSSTIEVYDPLDKTRVKKHIKPFMVNHAARVIEGHKMVLPDFEDERTLLVGQMREYVIIRRGASGRPVYTDSNEDMLTAWMLALLGFAMEYSELTNYESTDSAAIVEDIIKSRAQGMVSTREIGSPATEDILQTKYGIEKRQGVFQELVESYGIQYSYSRRGETPKLIEVDVPGTIVQNDLSLKDRELRGTRATISPRSEGRGFGGRASPGRRTF